MAFGWEGDAVRLVPLEKERHVENALRWLNDPVVTEWTLIGDFPLTRLAEQEFFDRVAKAAEGASDIGFAIETRAEDRDHIGFCGMHQISYRHGTAILGIIVGRPELWSRGLGKDALRTLTRYAFDVTGLRLLMAEVFSENERSIRMMQACGLREVARIAGRYWRRGAYRDVLLYTLSRDDWRQSCDGAS
ncbi:MAG: GNAT family protein [Planctomycetota bacterium]